MTLPAFDLMRPGSLEEALGILAEGENVHPIAGGTNLIPDMRKGTHAPSTLVDVSKLPELCCIRRKDGHLLIGGGVTIGELLDDPMAQQAAPILTQMARTFANTLIRNRATVGGNLVNAAPCADTAPALLVLDAEVELTSVEGIRWVRLGDFLLDAFKTERRPDELLTAIRFPIPPVGGTGGFQKMGLRKISCMAKVNVAAYVERDEAGHCRVARLALGAASAAAMRVPEAESVLTGRSLTPERIDEAARSAEAAAQPRAGSEYKHQVVYGLTRRILTEIAARPRGGTDGRSRSASPENGRRT